MQILYIFMKMTCLTSQILIEYENVNESSHRNKENVCKYHFLVLYLAMYV